MDPTFDHVLITLLNFKTRSGAYKYLKENDFTSVFDIAGLTIEEIDDIRYDEIDANGNVTNQDIQLPTFQRSSLKILKAFLRDAASKNNFVLSPQDIMNLTKSDYDTFRIIYDPNNPISPALSSATLNPRVPGNNNHLLQSFIKGIKRDKTQYPEIKDERNFDNWHQSFMGVATSHFIDEVFQEDYTPSPDEQELFDAKQKFAYSVLDHTLKTDMGKTLVRNHEITKDAQAIFSEFVAYSKTSSKAQINNSDILAWITSCKYDNTWKGSSESFVLYWLNKVREYNNCTIEETKQIHDDFKIIMLQNSVDLIPELRQVKITAQHDVSKGGTALNFDQYLSLLLSACATYDKSNSKIDNVKRQLVFTTNITPTDYDNLDTSFITVDEDDTSSDNDIVSIDTYLCNVTQQEKRKSSFRKQKVNETKHFQRPYISPDEWNTLTPNIKSILQNIKVPSNNNSQNNQRKVHFTDTSLESLNIKDDSTDNTTNTESNDPGTSIPDDLLLAYVTKQSKLPPTDIRRILSTSTGHVKKVSQGSTGTTTPSNNEQNIVEVNGTIYRKINTTTTTYHIHAKQLSTVGYTLVDRGANGGVFGKDVRIIEKTNRSVNLTGLQEHQVTDLPICTGAAIVQSQKGPIILIMHQYAYMGEGRTIHSSGQIEAYKNEVDDRSKKVRGGKQRIKTLDGYLLPLDIIQGLAHLKMRPPTDDELSSLPHVILTSDNEWDPSILDNQIDTSTDSWYDADDVIDGYTQHDFDDYGNYLHRYIGNVKQDDELIFFDAVSDEFELIPSHDLIDLAVNCCVQNYQFMKTEIKKKETDYQNLIPKFGWLPLDIIKRTIENTTQYARYVPLYNDMRHHFKSRFPAFNVKRRNEPVATDLIYSDTPAIDNGCTKAQFFTGRNSLVCDIYPVKTDKEFVNTLEDVIRERGAMDKLISDSAKTEISKKVLDILRALIIEAWQSEPYHQHQNFAERRYATIKSRTNIIMNRSGAPAHCWLLCIMYVCYLLNHTVVESLNWMTPMQKLTGQVTDISRLLQFQFYEEVYFTRHESTFPSESTENKGWFVGFGEHIGDTMTYKILTQDTLKIIYRSNVRSAEQDSNLVNKRIETNNNKDNDIIFVKSASDIKEEKQHVSKTLPGFNPSELIGRSFLDIPQEDGQRFRKRVIKVISDHQEDIDKHPHKKHFMVIDSKKREEILTYQELVDHIQRNNKEEDDIEAQYVRFKSVIAHQGPLKPSDPGYEGCPWNVMVDWEDGEQTYIPLSILAKDSPVACAIYAKKNKLLDLPGWRQFKRFVKNDKTLTRLINQTRLRSVRRTLRYQYGYLVPNTHEDAVMLDKENNNTLWQDAEAAEIQALIDYDTFIDKGKNATAPIGYQKIRCHMVYAVKHDGRHRARLVAGGHLTPVPLESVYSGVVTIRGLRMITFLAEHNNLPLWGADVGSAYLEAETQEKVYIIAGPEFGELAGHLLIIFKALYGLRSSGQRWHERFVDILRDIGFFPCKAEPDIWMRPIKDKYEYIGVYVDDLKYAIKDPQSFAELLRDKYNLQLKGVGPITFYLGCDYFKDPDGTLCYGPKKYVEKMLVNYEKYFNEKPKEYWSPLPPNDHPELDTTELCDDDGCNKYQSMIGEAQWAITLGRFDIHTAIMTLSRFRIAPRQGHLQRLQRVYGYLKKFKTAAIRIRTEEPDYSELHNGSFDWSYTVYGKVSETIPTDIPPPLGKHVILSHFDDANLYHDLLTGRAVTGILHLMNKTPIDWFSKLQSTVETATYGSEFVAARTAVDQIIDIRNTLRYLGVPVGKSYLFGDNQSVITSSTIPHSPLKKRHHALCYHRVREAYAAKIFEFHKIAGKLNPADILSKHLGHHDAWPLIEPFLFWRGDTALIDTEVRTKGECKRNASIKQDQTIN